MIFLMVEILDFSSELARFQKTTNSLEISSLNRKE